MHIDLHTHTTASDGVLSPAELVEKAGQRGVTALAITDHDTIDAYEELTGVDTGLTMIPGIEWSASWRRREIHVVGLGLDLNNPTLAEGVTMQQRTRRERAGRIAGKLEKLGVAEPLAGAAALAGNQTIGRPHFARHMVNTGFVREVDQAFSKYLAAGKPAYCRTEWGSLEQVIEWTHAAGGLAVLAHPADYKLTRTKLRELLTDFKAAGGDAMEVVSGRQQPGTTTMLSGLCRKLDLLASCGSDYHRTGPGCAEPGEFDAPPSACKPVWHDWPDCL